MGGHGQKWVTPFRSYGALKSGASHIWFDGLSRMIGWFLHADIDSIIFGVTTNLFCIFDICWVSTAKNDVLLLLPTGKVLELGFSKCFLIKAWLSVKRLFPVSGEGNWFFCCTGPTDPKFWQIKIIIIILILMLSLFF